MNEPQVDFTEIEASFLAAVVSLAVLLDYYGEHGWASWFRSYHRELETLAAAGASYTKKLQASLTLSSVFSGVGGFTDLIIHPRNGHTVDPTEVSEANRRLDVLRSEVYRLFGAYQRARFWELH